MSSNITWSDRLRDRGFIDQWGFMAFAIVGFAAIVSSKWLQAETVWVAVGAVVAMLLYALLVGRAGSGRLRADQAGDNCYYLGLIYTLASLSYAIATFDPGNTASAIVQGFGIALATTIFGLILRVFFSQGRPDLENVEAEMRLELTEAASRLKGELNNVVVNMNDFSRHFQQSMEELHKAATSSIEEFSSTSLEGLKAVAEGATESIRDEANDFVARSKEYASSFGKLVAKVDKHCDSFERIVQAQESVGDAAQAAKEVVESAQQSAVAALSTSEALLISAKSTEAAAASTQHVAAGLGESINQLRAVLTELREESNRRMKEVGSAPSEVVARAMEELSQASDGLKRHMAEVEQLQNSARESQKAQGEEALNTTKRHNRELGEELDRSRELLRLVHSSLADMTGKLASNMESVGT